MTCLGEECGVDKDERRALPTRSANGAFAARLFLGYAVHGQDGAFQILEVSIQSELSSLGAFPVR